MWRQSKLLITVTTLAACLSLGTGMAFAANPGSGPDAPQGGSSEWQKVDDGQRVWYSFNYAGDGSQVTVRMGAAPAGGVAFSIWTPSDVANWVAGGAENPVGRGSLDPFSTSDLLWSGSFNEAGVYFVVVDDASSDAGYYALTVAGSGVTLPGTAADEKTAVVAGADTNAAAASLASSESADGNTVERAIASDLASWRSIQPGQRLWHAFRYDGDGSQVVVRMSTSGSDGPAFSVWTPADLAAWARGEGENPVGRGSADATLGRDQIWSGNFNAAGTYYIVVDQPLNNAGSYSLQIVR